MLFSSLDLLQKQLLKQLEQVAQKLSKEQVQQEKSSKSTENPLQRRRESFLGAIQWLKNTQNQPDRSASSNKELDQAMMLYQQAVTYDDNGEAEKAAVLYQQSAELGCSAAQFNFALCCENGIGTSQNLNKAKIWYQQAADKNYPYAKESLERLVERERLEKPKSYSIS